MSFKGSLENDSLCERVPRGSLAPSAELELHVCRGAGACQHCRGMRVCGDVCVQFTHGSVGCRVLCLQEGIAVSAGAPGAQRGLSPCLAGLWDCHCDLCLSLCPAGTCACHCDLRLSLFPAGPCAAVAVTEVPSRGCVSPAMNSDIPGLSFTFCSLASVRAVSRMWAPIRAR